MSYITAVDYLFLKINNIPIKLLCKHKFTLKNYISQNRNFNKEAKVASVQVE